MKVFTKGEATTVVRPDSGPWTWPEPVDVMISNTYKFEPVGSFQWREDRGVYDHHPFDLSPMGDPLMFAIAVNMLETLYKGGYAVVKLDAEEDAVGDLTRAELLDALKVERERYEKAEGERKKLVESFRTANEAYTWMAGKYDTLVAEVRPWVRRDSDGRVYLNSPLLRDEQAEELEECSPVPEPQEAQP